MSASTVDTISSRSTRRSAGGVRRDGLERGEVQLPADPAIWARTTISERRAPAPRGGAQLGGDFAARSESQTSGSSALTPF